MRRWVEALGMAAAIWASADASGAQARETRHTVIASSFADPEDVAAYKACVAKGSHKDCLSVGDNGVGLWGDDTTSLTRPACALPRGVWQSRWGGGDAARSKPLLVARSVYTVRCALLDTLPTHPKHGVGIDLNPGAARALHLKPPFLVPGVTWRWAD